MEDRLAELYCWPKRYPLTLMRDVLNDDFPANISLDETYRKIQEFKMKDIIGYDDLYPMWWVRGNDAGGNALIPE